ncbi:MAG: A/G-specific adenine glycosylase [Bacteroidia bacterium]|jgi:A/G-specific adenine glycosylase
MSDVENEKKKHPVTGALMHWYQQSKRDLPWRDANDPYKIWLSEIILQQTRVDQGMPYYYRFIEKFPTVHAMAEASEDEILHLWQGLGYYARARNMHRAAQILSKEWKTFPADYAAIRALPGVGDYTAAAVASIAFNLPHAAVDGNVNRVLSRIWGVSHAVDGTEGKKIIAQLSNELLDETQPGAYNQAMMELGALCCKPRNPNCACCPVSNWCFALKHKRQTEFPIKKKAKETQVRHFNFLIFTDNSGFTLLEKRNNRDIWKGLYQFPLIESDAERQAIDIPQGGQLIRVYNGINHQLSHRLLKIKFWHIHFNGAFPDSTMAYHRIAFSDWTTVALPRAITRFLEQYSSTLQIEQPLPKIKNKNPSK